MRSPEEIAALNYGEVAGGAGGDRSASRVVRRGRSSLLQQRPLIISLIAQLL